MFRSPLTEALPLGENTHYSDLMVIQSGRRFYVGTQYNGPESEGITMPGSKDSEEYWETYQEARRALFNGTFTQRIQ